MRAQADGDSTSQAALEAPYQPLVRVNVEVTSLLVISEDRGVGEEGRRRRGRREMDVNIEEENENSSTKLRNFKRFRKVINYVAM